jgi:hypothetical protein
MVIVQGYLGNNLFRIDLDQENADWIGRRSLNRSST